MLIRYIIRSFSELMITIYNKGFHPESFNFLKEQYERTGIISDDALCAGAFNAIQVFKIDEVEFFNDLATFFFAKQLNEIAQDLNGGAKDRHLWEVSSQWTLLFHRKGNEVTVTQGFNLKPVGPSAVVELSELKTKATDYAVRLYEQACDCIPELRNSSDLRKYLGL